MRLKREFTDPIPERHRRNYQRQGVAAIQGRARFVDSNRIAVNDQILLARRVLIASGAKPVRLEMPGADHVIPSDQFLELAKLPQAERAARLRNYRSSRIP
jgi:glutathione reductase (NADPH)